MRLFVIILTWKKLFYGNKSLPIFDPIINNEIFLQTNNPFVTQSVKLQETEFDNYRNVEFWHL
jgi:hypothetical protein